MKCVNPDYQQIGFVCIRGRKARHSVSLCILAYIATAAVSVGFALFFALTQASG